MTSALTIRQPGRFNVANALAAVAAADHLGIDIHDTVERLGSQTVIPGRMQYVDAGQRWEAIVDYAHKPGALAALLDAVRDSQASRRAVHVVFGCGGDRDPGKRSVMGEIAASAADHVYLTDDNPRTEDPQTILIDIHAGCQRVAPSKRAHIHVLPNRRSAIEAAVNAAAHNDVVIVAGKGHETGQTHQGVTVPFDDRTVLTELIQHRLREPLARPPSTPKP